MDEKTAGWTIEQQRRIWVFLTGLRSDPHRSIEELERDAAMWANTDDLTEGWLAAMELDAAKLLDELPQP